MSEFGKRFKAAREAAGYTQAEIAERAGSTQPAVARVEAGGINPSEELMGRLAEAVGSELWRLLKP